jgi:tripartite-type tricarboxylate transporter receptor subunit TctC
MSIRAHCTGALFFLAASLSGVVAQDSYPNRPIIVVSPWTAGGVGEISARLIGDPMGKALGQPLVIDSRAGGASKIGTEAVVRAPKDGYTLLFQNVVHSILPTVAAPLSYDPIGGFAPIVQTTSYPLMLVAHPSLPANALPELIIYLKNNPGKVSYSSGGPGSAMQFAGEMLKIMAGVDMLHVPYRGMSAAVNDTIAGHVQLSFDSFSTAAIDAGRLKAIATTGPTRDPRFPDVPAIAEFYPGYRLTAWQGFFAPAGVPRDIVMKLNAAANTALADANVQAKFKDMGLTVVGGTPEEFATLIRDDIAMFKRVATEAKLTFQ